MLLRMGLIKGGMQVAHDSIYIVGRVRYDHSLVISLEGPDILLSYLV